tara:strand:+ start:594 stop:1133 length:540 start_codon:yes stop_codon:yes gene_type:complete
MKIYKQKSRFISPLDLKTKLKILIWEFTWFFLCSWTPKPFNKWRILILKIFNCQIYGEPMVHQKAIITRPWNLILHDRSCLGERSVAYAHDIIELKELATVAQETYLCTATHKFDEITKPLMTDKIIVEYDAFIGARSFIMPGVKVGKNSIIGSCSVVTKNIPENSVAYGNPATVKKTI